MMKMNLPMLPCAEKLEIVLSTQSRAALYGINDAYVKNLLLIIIIITTLCNNLEHLRLTRQCCDTMYVR